MTNFFRWLMGLRQSPDWIEGGRWHVEFASLPQGPSAIAAALLFVAVAAGIGWLYKKEGRTIALGARLALVALRCLVVTCLVFMLLEMVLVITKQELIP